MCNPFGFDGAAFIVCPIYQKRSLRVPRISASRIRVMACRESANPSGAPDAYSARRPSLAIFLSVMYCTGNEQLHFDKVAVKQM